jgi:prepilin-type N-terminal cleavage/methylation domain-containing protein
MKRGFTLIELVVAIAILAIIAGFAGAIFHVSVDSHRIASANAEIMQKLRALTDQLGRDCAGIRKDAPMAILFRMDPLGKRRDSIAFVADGDFQSVRQYWRMQPDESQVSKTVAGNLASVYYGPAMPSDPNILARKQKMLTYDIALINRPVLSDPDEFLIDSFAAWRIDLNDVTFPDWVAAPMVNPQLEEELPLYMMTGVTEFMIQIADLHPEEKVISWFPADYVFNGGLDRDGDGMFGFYYNIPNDLSISDWRAWFYNWPRAIKFTFTLTDSKNIVPERTFTHIVYIGD